MSVLFGFGNHQEPIPRLFQHHWEKSKPSWKQVHGIAVAEVTDASQECGEADAIWTRMKNLPIAVVTADCVPILLYRRDEKAIAAIHAGWRGVEQRIVRHFFNAMPSDLSHGKDWVAVLGPSIRACCYEVSEALVQQFQNQFPEILPSKISPLFRKLDLIQVLQYELNALGVQISSVSPDCTFCALSNEKRPAYYSYRRGDRNSRQLSIIENQSSKL